MAGRSGCCRSRSSTSSRPIPRPTIRATGPPATASSIASPPTASRSLVARFDDPENIWIFYVDSENACGQVGGAGGAGRAVMGRDDLDGLLFAKPYNRCGEFYNLPIERWMGGLGHELGHTLGLPRPPGASRACRPARAPR